MSKEKTKKPKKPTPQEKKKQVFLRKLGRPTKYRKEYIQRMYDYFNVPAIDAKTSEAVLFPTMEKFAADIAVNTDTLVEWANARKEDSTLKYPDFSAMYSICKQLQKNILVTNGLMGKYASNFATFVAINLTDMVNKSEVDATSKGHRIGGFIYQAPENPNDTDSINSED